MGTLSQNTRERYAVIHSGGESKFPINDKNHARAALGRINQAKPPLTREQKLKVIARAHAMLSSKK